MYIAGPGNVIGTYRQWKGRREDSSEVSKTYSGQFYDICREVNAEAYVIASNQEVGWIREEQFTIEHRPPYTNHLRGIFYHLKSAWYEIGLIKSALTYRPDLMVVCEGRYWFLYSTLARLGVPVVADLHCVLWPTFSKVGRSANWINRLNRSFFSHRALATLAVSNDIADQVNQVAGSHPRPLIQYRPTYHRDAFSGITKPTKDGNPFRVLFAGRVERNKGVYDLLAIGQRFAAEGHDNVEFDVCGSGTELNALRESVRAAGLEKRFRCHGHCDRATMRAMYSQCHAVIVPTTSQFAEGFNKVVVEGILAGRPVITSMVCPALVEVSEAAIGVPPDDVRAYGDAIIRLRDDQDLYERKCLACASLQDRFYDEAQSYGSALRQALRQLNINSQTSEPVRTAACDRGHHRISCTKEDPGGAPANTCGVDECTRSLAPQKGGGWGSWQ